MKILIITDGVYPFSMGGSHRLIYEKSLVLSHMGHQVTCVIPEIAETSYMSMHKKLWSDSDNFRILRFPIDARNWIKKVISYFTGFRLAVDELVAKEEFDLINIHYLPALFALRNFKSQPIYYTFHGPWAAETRLSYSGRVDSKGWYIKIAFKLLIKPFMYWGCFIIERYCLKKCQNFMTLSKYMCDILSTAYDIDRGKITIIPGGVNTMKFFPEEDEKLREKYASGEKYIFLTVRRLEKRMGLDNLIKACALLKKKNDKFILLIGGKGYYSEYLKSLIKKNNCEKNIFMLDFIPDDKLRRYMTISDLFILPSMDLEGFGLVVLESMACGTPVLVGPNGGPQEVVREFDNQFVMHSLRSEDIANSILGLIESGILDDDISNRSLNFTQKYSWENFTIKYIEWMVSNLDIKH